MDGIKDWIVLICITAISLEIESQFGTPVAYIFAISVSWLYSKL